MHSTPQTRTRTSQATRAGLGLALLGMLFAGGAHAMKVEPGKWEFRATGQAMDRGQLEVTTTCVAAGEITHESFTEDALGCEISDAHNDDRRISLSVKCDTGNGVAMQGDARFESKGERVEVRMTLRMNAGGVSMSFDRQWEGKRLGDCD